MCNKHCIFRTFPTPVKKTSIGISLGKGIELTTFDLEQMYDEKTTELGLVADWIPYMEEKTHIILFITDA